MSTPFQLLVPRQFVTEMVDQAQAELPNECCGLLAGLIENDAAGRVGLVVRRYPLVNAAANPTEFDSEPRSMFAAVKAMRGESLDILAVYHSHPTSPPIPSRTDLERSYSPDVVNLIISLLAAAPEIRGWWLHEGTYREAEVRIME